MNSIMKLYSALAEKMGLTVRTDPKISANMLFFYDAAQNPVHIIYFRVRNSTDGFWGLTENQLDFLATGGTGFTVLLISKSNIYSLTKNDVRHIRSTFKLQADGDYRINARDLVKLPVAAYKLWPDAAEHNIA